jgi:hypothetical protein
MPQTGPQRTVIVADAFDAQPMIDDFPSSYSTDSSANSASSSTAPTYDVSPLDDGSAIVCRDHFKPVDLWWSSPNGSLVSFHLNPPLLLVSKGPGGYTDKKGQKFANAVYETLAASTGTDASGQKWGFRGRFSAYCRNGNLEIGPIVFGGQLLVALSPIDRPYPIGSGGGDAGSCNSQIIYDPSTPPDQTCPGGGGGGGTGGGGGSGPGGSTCTSEYIYIEISYDGGATWSVWWEGYASVCQ